MTTIWAKSNKIYHKVCGLDYHQDGEEDGTQSRSGPVSGVAFSFFDVTFCICCLRWGKEQD